jgi:hypothetical protein
VFARICANLKEVAGMHGPDVRLQVGHGTDRGRRLRDSGTITVETLRRHHRTVHLSAVDLTVLGA